MSNKIPFVANQGESEVGSMEGWKGRTQKGQLLVRIFIFDISYNQPGSYQDKKDSINGHGFHNFASFLVIGFAFRWVNYNEQKGGRK
jgi:hypothetical protein